MPYRVQVDNTFVNNENRYYLAHEYSPTTIGTHSWYWGKLEGVTGPSHSILSPGHTARTKKFITARNRSPPLNRSWAPLRHRHIRSATADGPSYRSESFDLHKILWAVRSGQFSTPAKFTYAPTTPSQSLATLDESSRTLGSARNLDRWTTAASPALPGRWSNVAQTLVERL